MLYSAQTNELQCDLTLYTLFQTMQSCEYCDNRILETFLSNSRLSYAYTYEYLRFLSHYSQSLKI